MTEEFVESYSSPANRNIFRHVSVEFNRQVAVKESNTNIWAIEKCILLRALLQGLDHIPSDLISVQGTCVMTVVTP